LLVINEDFIPWDTLWYEVIGSVCFNPRSSVFGLLKTEKKSKAYTMSPKQVPAKASY
jgi:hypothetical protein